MAFNLNRNFSNKCISIKHWTKKLLHCYHMYIVQSKKNGCHFRCLIRCVKKTLQYIISIFLGYVNIFIGAVFWWKQKRNEINFAGICHQMSYAEWSILDQNMQLVYWKCKKFLLTFAFSSKLDALCCCVFRV